MNDLMLTSSQFTVQCLIQTTKVVAAHNTIDCRKIIPTQLQKLVSPLQRDISFPNC